MSGHLHTYTHTHISFRTSFQLFNRGGELGEINLPRLTVVEASLAPKLGSFTPCHAAFEEKRGMITEID